MHSLQEEFHLPAKGHWKGLREMRRMLQGILSLDLLLFAGLVACLATFLMYSPSSDRIFLLDRPRLLPEDTDFVLEFLEVTQTPYVLEEGFVSFNTSQEVEGRLLQLLSALNSAIEITERNMNAPLDQRMRIFPSPTGEIHIVPDTKRSSISLLEDQQQLQALQRQHAVVFGAIQYLKPGAVGRSFASSAEPIAKLPIPLGDSDIQQASGWETPTEARSYSQPPKSGLLKAKTSARANVRSTAVHSDTPVPPASHPRAPSEDDEIVDLDEISGEPARSP